MREAIKLPKMGESIQEAEVGEIYVQEGDEIDIDQNILSLETDKASTDLPSPKRGKIAKLNVHKGDTVKVGATLVELESEDTEDTEEARAEGDGKKDEQDENGEDRQSQVEAGGSETEATGRRRQGAAKADEAETESDEAQIDSGKAETESDEDKTDKVVSSLGGEGTITATPVARRVSRNLGIDLETVTKRSDERIVTVDDVIATFAADIKEQLKKIKGESAEALPDFSEFGETTSVKPPRIARLTARNTSRAWREIPHVCHHDLCNIAALEALRKKYNSDRMAQGDRTGHITLTAVLVRLLAALLPEFPKLNASFDASSGEIIYKKYFNIGVATDTGHGLVVPVVKNANQLSLKETAAKLQEFGQKSKDGSFHEKDFVGGSFTLTNVGSIGGTYFTPIINWPDVAILGTGAAWQEEDKLQLPISLSYDHRVINGADAARFVNRLKEDLSAPEKFIADL